MPFEDSPAIKPKPESPKCSPLSPSRSWCSLYPVPCTVGLPTASDLLPRTYHRADRNSFLRRPRYSREGPPQRRAGILRARVPPADVKRGDDVRVTPPALAQVAALRVVERGVGQLLHAEARELGRCRRGFGKAPAPRNSRRVSLDSRLTSMQ